MFGMWYKYWLDVAENSDVPIYFFKFEDILKDTQGELEKLMSFILGIFDSVEGTVIQERIKEVMSMDEGKRSVYKPRAATTGNKQSSKHKNLHKYADDQIILQYVQNESLLHIFGYVDHPDVPEHNRLYDYKSKGLTPSAENVKKLNYFEKLNEKAWKLRK
jgi:hypothetical protein